MYLPYICLCCKLKTLWYTPTTGICLINGVLNTVPCQGRRKGSLLEWVGCQRNGFERSQWDHNNVFFAPTRWTCTITKSYINMYIYILYIYQWILNVPPIGRKRFHQNFDEGEEAQCARCDARRFGRRCEMSLSVPCPTKLIVILVQRYYF